MNSESDDMVFLRVLTCWDFFSVEFSRRRLLILSNWCIICLCPRAMLDICQQDHQFIRTHLTKRARWFQLIRPEKLWYWCCVSKMINISGISGRWCLIHGGPHMQVGPTCIRHQRPLMPLVFVIALCVLGWSGLVFNNYCEFQISI